MKNFTQNDRSSGRKSSSRSFGDKPSYYGGGRSSSYGSKPSFSGGRSSSYGSKPSFGGSRSSSSFGDKRGYESRDSTERRKPSFNRDSTNIEMFEAICDDCGKHTTLPFKPTQGKPVYCKDCFRERNENHSDFPKTESRNYENRRQDNYSDRDNSSNKDKDIAKLAEQIDSLNYKLDRILKVLETK